MIQQGYLTKKSNNKVKTNDFSIATGLRSKTGLAWSLEV